MFLFSILTWLILFSKLNRYGMMGDTVCCLFQYSQNAIFLTMNVKLTFGSQLGLGFHRYAIICKVVSNGLILLFFTMDCSNLGLGSGFMPDYFSDF
jgi:hypothetical protein